jgi:hypothetical protein
MGRVPQNLQLKVGANKGDSLAGFGIGGIREIQQMLDFCSKYNIFSTIELIPIHSK